MVDKKSDTTDVNSNMTDGSSSKEPRIDKPFISVVSKRSGWSLFSRPMLLTISVLLVVIGVGGLFWYLNKEPQSASLEAAEQRGAVLNDVAEANQKRDYSREAVLLQEYIDSNPPAEYAGDEIVRLGVAYTNAKDYENAIEAFQTAVDKYPASKYAGIRSLGIVYMQRGDDLGNKTDYQTALSYFEQALELAKADPEKRSVVPADESNIRFVRTKIQ